MMLLSYLTVALRHARKHKVYALFNLLGLVIAFAAFGLILIYLHYETGFESFHTRADRIYRASYRYIADNGHDVHWARTYADYVNELPREIPEVETLIRFQNQEQKYVRVGREKFKPQHAYLTDADVFDAFDFPLLAGDPQTALVEPYSVVLTASLARTYFGETGVVGKELYLSGNYSSEEKAHTITGVMADLPANTHLPVDLLISFRDSAERSWWAYVYVLLKEGAELADLEAKMPAFMERHIESDGGEAQFVYQPLPDIHLNSHLAREIVPGGNARYVTIFFFVGGFILLIALINYLNMSSALAMTRSREIGLRRIFGAGNQQLIRYSLTESLAYTLLAAGIGWLVVGLVFPWFQEVTGAAFLLSKWALAGGMLLAAIVCGLLAGLYPAMVLHSFRAIDLLKARKNLPVAGSNAFNLRRSLVALQFGLSILLIGSAGVVGSQFRYLNKKNLGLEKSQILAIPGVADKVTADFPLFRDRVQAVPGVQSVAACMEVPSREIRDMGPLMVTGVHSDPERAPMVDVQVISPGFVETMGVELIAGEDRSGAVPYGEPPQFSETYSPQEYFASRPRSYLINETAMKLLGWQSPEEAIGREVSWSIASFELAAGPITGVVRDFHQESLKNRIDPMVLLFEPVWLRTFLVKVETENIAQTIAQIEAAWDEVYPSFPMEYHFLDELYEALYQSERTQLQLLAVFSGLAIFIAFMGLLSLVAWSLHTRSRELAVRRVLGAGRGDLIRLMGKEYLLVLLLSTLLAVPLSYVWVSEWLQQFAYRIAVSPMSYVWTLSLMGLLLVATVSLQTLRATTTNPVDTLREE